MTAAVTVIGAGFVLYLATACALGYYLRLMRAGSSGSTQEDLDGIQRIPENKEEAGVVEASAFVHEAIRPGRVGLT